MHLQELDTSQRFTATVVDTEPITPSSKDEVREIVLDVADSELTLDVGQSVGVLAPGDAAFGQDHHLRLYSVADLPEQTPHGPRIKICVKRCSYIDDYRRRALRRRGVELSVRFAAGRRADAHRTVWAAVEVPPERRRQLDLDRDQHRDRAVSRVRASPVRADSVFGADLAVLRRNERPRSDLPQRRARRLRAVLRQGDVRGVQGAEPRPHWGDDIAWAETIQERGEELWRLLSDSRTYVYIAGLESIRDALYAVFAAVAGSQERWERRRAELTAGKRWVELLY